MTAWPFSASSEAVGSSASRMAGLAGQGPGDRHPLALARAQLRGRSRARGPQARPGPAARPPALASAQATPRMHRASRTLSRAERRREQVEGLEDEAEVSARGTRSAAAADPRRLPGPSTSTLPASGVRMQPSSDSSVVLPLPEGPTRKTTSPRPTSRLMPRRIGVRFSPGAEALVDVPGRDGRLSCVLHRLAGRRRRARAPGRGAWDRTRAAPGRDGARCPGRDAARIHRRAASAPQDAGRVDPPDPPVRQPGRHQADQDHQRHAQDRDRPGQDDRRRGVSWPGRCRA